MLDLYHQVELTKTYKKWIKEYNTNLVHNIYLRYDNYEIEDGEEYFIVYSLEDKYRYFIEIISDTYFMIELSEEEKNNFILNNKSFFFPSLKLSEYTINQLKNIK